MLGPIDPQFRHHIRSVQIGLYGLLQIKAIQNIGLKLSYTQIFKISISPLHILSQHWKITTREHLDSNTLLNSINYRNLVSIKL